MRYKVSCIANLFKLECDDGEIVRFEQAEIPREVLQALEIDIEFFHDLKFIFADLLCLGVRHREQFYLDLKALKVVELFDEVLTNFVGGVLELKDGADV